MFTWIPMAVISGSRVCRPRADDAAPGDGPNEQSSLKRTVIPNTARRNRVTGTPLQRGAVAAMGDERSASVETAAAVDIVVVRTLRSCLSRSVFALLPPPCSAAGSGLVRGRRL